MYTLWPRSLDEFSLIQVTGREPLPRVTAPNEWLSVEPLPKFLASRAAPVPADTGISHANDGIRAQPLLPSAVNSGPADGLPGRSFDRIIRSLERDPA